MTEASVAAGKTPWWHWVVCAIAVLWNGFGAFDFAMSVTQGEPYYRSMGMNDAQIAYMQGYPAWTYLVWFVGTWGAFAGAVLLVLRRRWALHAFVASLVGFLLSLVYAYFLSTGAEVLAGTEVFNVIIFLGCIFFIGYSRFATTKGVLR